MKKKEEKKGRNEEGKKARMKEGKKEESKKERRNKIKNQRKKQEGKKERRKEIKKGRGKEENTMQLKNIRHYTYFLYVMSKCLINVKSLIQKILKMLSTTFPQVEVSLKKLTH